jgi:hypothetical protein
MDFVHFVQAVCLSNFSEDMVVGVFYSGFFDASGENEGYPLLTVAGAVAPMKKWHRFDLEWKDALAVEGVKQFHMTDFAAHGGEFKDWKGNTKRRSAFFNKLVSIVQKNVNKLICCSVEIPAWQTVNEEYFLEEFFFSPYTLASYAIVQDGRKWAGKKSGVHQFFFEEGDDGWDGLVKLCERAGIPPIRVPKSITPCQVGDLIAWKIRIAGTNSLEYLKIPDASQVLKELKSLQTVLVRPTHNKIFTLESLRETCKKNNIPLRKGPVTV